MESVVLWFLLWAASVAMLSVSLANWGSDSPYWVAAFLTGWILSTFFTIVGLVFVVCEAGFWLWQHVRLEVTL